MVPIANLSVHLVGRALPASEQRTADARSCVARTARSLKAPDREASRPQCHQPDTAQSRHRTATSPGKPTARSEPRVSPSCPQRHGAMGPRQRSLSRLHSRRRRLTATTKRSSSKEQTPAYCGTRLHGGKAPWQARRWRATEATWRDLDANLDPDEGVAVARSARDLARMFRCYGERLRRREGSTGATWLHDEKNNGRAIVISASGRSANSIRARSAWSESSSCSANVDCTRSRTKDGGPRAPFR